MHEPVVAVITPHPHPADAFYNYEPHRRRSILCCIHLSNLSAQVPSEPSGADTVSVVTHGNRKIKDKARTIITHSDKWALTQIETGSWSTFRADVPIPQLSVRSAHVTVRFQEDGRVHPVTSSHFPDAVVFQLCR